MSELLWTVVFCVGKFLSGVDSFKCFVAVAAVLFSVLFGVIMTMARPHSGHSLYMYRFVSFMPPRCVRMQAMWSALHQVACKYSDRFGALFVNVEYLLIKPSEAMITLGWVLRFPGEFLICNVDEELNGVKRQITGDGWFDEKFLIVKGNDGVDEIRLSSETRHHMILLSKRMPTARIIVRETGIVVKWRPDGLDVQGLSALLESVLQLAVQLYAELASQASAEAPLRVHPELKPRREMLTALFNRADAPAWYQLVAPQPIERGQTGQVFAELGRRDERLRSRPLEPRGGAGRGEPVGGALR